MRILAFLTAVLLLSGCGVELLTTTAIQGELQAEQLKAMRGQVQRAAGTSGRINLQRALDTYKAEKGANPPSLDALVPGWIPTLPTQEDGSPYGYDPVSGQLLTGPNAAGAANDQQMIQQIQAAINRYGTAVGYYPPTLDALVPAYLPSPPRTSTGQPFVYNNQNGYVGLPGSAPLPAQAARPGVPVGAGPMGEAMTGIAMQNQLNSMSNAGASAAGTRMRGATRENAGDHNAMQNQVMDNLGL
ncbi:MAG: hypothetical protein HYV26_13860 [Candidatus Hydrogenedentes bacterium]|nr:hypothetical protein [Candidatus Hydrogenedentota bacterium]